MKVVAYSVKPFEKEFLAKANQKKHDITLISNPLASETSAYAEGKEAVIVFTEDDVSASVIEKLAGLGIRYIVTRSVGTDHIDKEAAAKYDIKISNVPSYSPEAIAEHAVALAFALNRQILRADRHVQQHDFRNDDLVGFNFCNKTVGIIGLGHTGKAAARIFNGIGTNVIGFDLNPAAAGEGLKLVSFDNLLAESDIISLHLPLTPDSRNLINKEAIRKMKNGVMLINTSRGDIIETKDILEALQKEKIGYFGLDLFENESDIVFGDLLSQLMEYPNVLITPHQAYLTKEALQEISNTTIKNLDLWQLNKCVGDACICAKDCKKNQFVSTPNDK